MRHQLFIKLGIVALGILLVLNLVASVRTRAAAPPPPEPGKRVQYKLVRVDSSTNEDLLFEDAGRKGLELAGTIEIAGNTGYLVFKK